MLEAIERPTEAARRMAVAAVDRFLPAAAVMKRYGISDESLRRWLRKDSLAFPRPTYISRRHYWPLRQLIEWERLQAELSAAEDDL